MTQPEALRLADSLIDCIDGPPFHIPHYEVREAAAELRRLHEENESLRQALAQPEQKPVAWGMQRKDGVIIDVICPEEHSREPGDYTIPLYIAPPKRKFVGLAKKEKFKVLKEFFGNSQQMIDAVEAKLKEKNT